MGDVDAEGRFDFGFVQYRVWGSGDLRGEFVAMAGLNLAIGMASRPSNLLRKIVPRADALI